MTKKRVVQNHEITRHRGVVKINGQETPLRFSEAVKAISAPSPEHWMNQWDRTSQKWVPVCQ